MSHAAPPASTPSAGTLFLMPAPLDFGCEPPAPLEAALPRLAIETAARLAFWVSENARSTRAFLKRVNAIAPLAQPLQAVQIAELPRAAHKQGDHAGGGGARFDARALLAPALAGHDMALISEAGLPAVADPGSSVVRAAHEAGVPVQPLAGPSSLLLALAASGLNGQSFAFNGYLPQEAAARARRIRELEALALKTGQTQLFIETPYRNATLQPATRLSVSQGLTLPAARCRTLPASAWRQLGADAAPGREPAIFAIGL